jgi:Peptidase family M23
MSGRALGILLLVLVGGGCAALAALRCEGHAPDVSAPDELTLGRDARTVKVEIADEGSGLREAQAVLMHARGEAPLAAQRFPGSAIPLVGPRPTERATLELQIDPRALELPEGTAQLRLTVRDWSWRNGLRGNETSLEIPVTVDLHPPRIALRPGLTYASRGGAGALAYRVSEDTVRDGVEVGDRWFPGVPAPGADAGSGARVALFALPVDAPDASRVRVVAEDGAGNRAVADGRVRVQARSFPEAPMSLSTSFLDGKVVELAGELGIDASDPVQAFSEINTRIRARDEAHIREIVAESAPQPLFQGAFEQWANSKVTSRFAERRVYRVGDREVSQATHYGYDLASTAGAPVTASNGGRVLFAGDLGIYGNCVILDHGLGLASLYGHLSSIEVEPGESVEKGQRLGVSGQTGLAGGDHLHFAILLRGEYVDPVEWWDPKWVRERIEARLEPEAP